MNLRALLCAVCAAYAAWVPWRARAQVLPASDARYEIEVELDPQHHTLHGRERIHFTNHSAQPLEALEFHLYLNAFRDRKSVFMREDGGALRGAALRNPGWCTIEALRDASGRDLLAGAERELVPGDFTQLRAPLFEPLPPGAALDLTLEFFAQLPELVARAGYAGEFYVLGQWFPKLAALTASGFANFPYHGLGEFFADFADYRVAIALPDRFELAGSGQRVLSVHDVARRVDTFEARHVHDVAFAAYPYFITDNADCGRTLLEVYAPSGYRAALQRQLRVLCAALPYFERRYGPYPYPTLTAVIPPDFAYAASGMEYPTFFMSGGPFWALPAELPDPAQDGVSTHELAHQWFSGMVASDELSYPMLDEGLAQWSALDFLRAYYRTPPSWFADHAEPFTPFDVERALFAFRPRKLPSSLLPAPSYRWETLGPAVYMRPALVLERIAERRGRARLTAALGHYARSQRFRHPKPTDLFEAFDAEFGRGFAGRVLRPALEGQTPASLREPPAHGPPSGSTFLPELLALGQLLFGRLGP